MRELLANSGPAHSVILVRRVHPRQRREGHWGGGGGVMIEDSILMIKLHTKGVSSCSTDCLAAFVSSCALVLASEWGGGRYPVELACEK